MKFRINWKFAILFLIIAAGLMYLTGSFFMSAGIMLLLFVADYAIASLQDMLKRKKENNDVNK